MHGMIKQDSIHEVEEQPLADGDSFDFLIHAADELRQTLRMNDRSFRFMSRAHNSRGRRHVVYSVLDEIEQVAMALKLSEESLSEAPRDEQDDEVGERLLRNAFAAVGARASLAHSQVDRDSCGF